MLRLSTTIRRRVSPIRSQNATRLIFVYKSDVIGLEVYCVTIMTTCTLVSVKSAVKGYHVYRNEFPKGTILEYLQEPEDEYSESAIIMKKGETVIGHVTEGLCQLFTKFFNDGRVINILVVITGPPWPSLNRISLGTGPLLEYGRLLE